MSYICRALLNLSSDALITQANRNGDGNWTPELSRQKLNQYCQVNKILFDMSIDEKISGDGKNRVGT